MIATVVVRKAWGVAQLAGCGCRLVHSGPRLPAGPLAGVLARWSHAGVAPWVAGFKASG
ncbi:MAG: hypothetical protein ACYDAQ_05350 [Mycobacteriales bacterium]